MGGGATGLAYDLYAAVWSTFEAGGLPITDEPVVAWADGLLIAWGGFSADQGSGGRLADAGIRYRPPRS